MGLLLRGRLGLNLRLGIRIGNHMVLWHDGRVSRGLASGDRSIRVVLLHRHLGGDDRGDSLSIRLCGRDQAVNGLDLLGLSGGGFGCPEELCFPLGQRLDGRDVARALFRFLVALDQALGCGIRDDAGEQADGTDRVIVAGDRVLDLVGVAVGVEDRDDRDAEFVRLVDREVLLLRVDYPDRGRGLREVADSSERALQFD